MNEIKALWGKSRTAGGPSLLLQHLFDTAAVAELIWDRYLSTHLRERLDGAFGGRGRLAFTWIAGVHDVGKASAQFQALDADLAAAVVAAGLPVQRGDMPHPVVGYLELRDYLTDREWSRKQWNWFSLMVLGHHGKFAVPTQKMGTTFQRESPKWKQTRRTILEQINGALEVDEPPMPIRIPSRGTQLALSAAVSMADWIASDSRNMPPVWLPDEPSMELARTRAGSVWKRLRLRGGWDAQLLGHENLMQRRFGRSPRPLQELVQQVAEQNPALMIVEAPTGEGKTEAALVATELVARQVGADGVFVGMPTQATSDPMFSRVLSWLERLDPEAPVGLLHGKRRLNPDWQLLQESIEVTGVDEFDCPDPYSTSSHHSGAGSRAPSEWFLGRRRGLLMPNVVGTIDQLLMAATRTRYVGFRHLGLSGKVAVLDEVHACDPYMSQFLKEALRWLAQTGVPVILLTATLPPSMRKDLVRAYAQGLLNERDVDVVIEDGHGYPRVTYLCAVDPLVAAVQCCSTVQPSREVALRVLEEGEDWAGLVTLLQSRLGLGGTALVVCNSVGRAQQCFLALKELWGSDVVLLHGRFTAAQRSTATSRLLDELGPPETGQERPLRRVVVATQVAEQSFDIDADLLVTDIAPMDLLIQRAGRLHRHQRPIEARGPAVRSPEMVVMGIRERSGEAPEFDRASESIYGRWHLLSAAVDVLASKVWTLPDQAPDLVARAYTREQWQSDWIEDVLRAQSDRDVRDERRVTAANDLLLAGEDSMSSADLRGLHERDTSDQFVEATVRDGEQSAEVVLVRRDDTGFLTLEGARMGVIGEVVRTDLDILQQVIGASVRLPADAELAQAAEHELRPLPGWTDDPWLGHSLALPLTDQPIEFAGWHIEYDDELGLITQRVRSRS